MGGTNPRYANGYRRRQAVARLRAERRGCWICRAFGRPDAIDYDLPAGDPMSFEADDLVPVSKGGDPTSYHNLDAAHRQCNNWRKAKTVAQVIEIARRSGGVRQVTPTTDW